MRLSILLVLVAMASMAASARADIPQPPPEDCPRGSVGVGTRGGSYCAPTECAHCGSDQRCSPEPIALCVVTTDVPVPPPPGSPGETGSMRISHVTGPCENGRCSAEGARCERAPRCLPMDDEVFHSGLCSASRSDGPLAPALVCSIVAFVFARRRAR